MEDDKETLERRSVEVRTQIKSWEREFLDINGRKPARKDVSADAAIASKYKEYENLRATMAGKALPHTWSRGSKKRKATMEQLPQSPSKRAPEPISTPRKTERFANADESAVVEASTPLPPPRPLFLGPTPQKDGIFVSIFDHIQVETPSQGSRSVLLDADVNPLRTPSKGFQSPDGALQGMHFTRTPVSTGRRFMLDQMVTPRKDDMADQASPSSMAHKFQTPSFLRRISSDTRDAVIHEDSTSPRAARPWKRPTIMRSLSSMIKGMRKDEDDRLDADLDALRDMEEEADEEEEKDRIEPTRSPFILTDGDSGVGGLDEEGFLKSTIGAELAAVTAAEAVEAEKNGQPKVAWKKKGQKRQTRRVIMRPVKNKLRQKNQESMVECDDEEEEDGFAKNEKDETQTDENNKPDEIYNSMPEEEEDDDDDKNSSRSKRSKNAKDKDKKKDSSSRKARKVKPEAHANYRRLKIKNKNSKANGRGRFGRR